eukprot:TRINITY_DN12182_c0_g1_i3.p1 TRINITY_DN12182_c0_g1~~TRINITY_DN12182_c0_g1_i3.p1  ORF type:complete len:801 (-),score=160.38 TRINITY_DN12182_c0_g1_i3:319-2721(-)
MPPRAVRPRGILLTGPPGIGKSTACRRIAEFLAEKNYTVEGFLTEELRERGTRVGFDLVGLGKSSSERASLARAGVQGNGPHVGKYLVTMAAFENMALPILDGLAQANGKSTVCIVDEIGKMELFSERFVASTRDLLRKPPVPIIFTVALRGGGLIAESKRTAGFELIELSEANRDDVPAEVLQKLLGEDVGDSVKPWKAAARQSTGIPAGSSTASSTGQQGRRWKKKEGAASAEGSPEIGTASSSTAPAPAAAPAATDAKRVVVWLRNELRMADNPLLARAVKTCEASGGVPFLPTVCCDPKTCGPAALTAFGSPKLGQFRRRFLEESMADLNRSLSRCGSQLYICDAAPEDVLPAMAGEGGLVLAVREACVEERAAEDRCLAALKKVGAHLELLDVGGVTCLFGAGELHAAGLAEAADFPEDFQVFYDAVRVRVQHVCRDAGGLDIPCRLPGVAAGPAAQPPGLRDGKALPSACPGVEGAAAAVAAAGSCAGPPFVGGESEARARMRHWLDGGHLRRYKSNFRRLAGDYSSRLAAHLALGCLSPRRLAQEAIDAAGAPGANAHIVHFTYELCWRDFFRHAARRWGSTMFQQDGPLGETKSWKRDKDAEAKWKAGQTGLPLVDAAMRELNATGYMGNLARQFSASYLVEELGLDWRVGADWFESMLVDYDAHSNWGQWARSAGVAPTNDAKRRRVGGTRYYDLALGLGAEAVTYIRAWVPELKDLEDVEVIAPWRGAGASANGYPSQPLCAPNLKRYFETAADKGVQPFGGNKGGKGRGGGGYDGKASRWSKGRGKGKY